MIDIKKILEDVYALAPELRSQEAELIRVISEMLKLKPEIKADANFISDLKQRLASAPVQEKTHFSWSLKHPLVYAGAGAGLCLALFIIIALPQVKDVSQISGDVSVDTAKKTSDNTGSISLALGNRQVNRLGRAAFGSLSGINSGNQEAAMAPDASATNSRLASPQSAMGAGAGSAPSAVSESNSFSAKRMAVDSIMAPAISYKYSYQGDISPLIASSTGLSVFRRVKDGSLSSTINSQISGLQLGLVDMSKFGNLQVTSLSFNEDRDNGLSMYMSPEDNSISIGQNWMRWSRPDSACQDEACFASFRMKIGDLLQDQETIAIANSFVKEYDISLDGYGAPYVEDSWKLDYEVSEDKANYYLPESAVVIYPLVFNGLESCDEGGNRYGLQVSVDFRSRKVSSVYNLVVNKYDSANYELESDVSRILKVAENGGTERIYYMQSLEGGSQEVTVPLANPKLVLAHTWQNSAGSNVSQELYVPAIRFEVVKTAGINVWRRFVTVPLVKEILDEREKQPQIMPMMKGAADTSVSAPEIAPSTGKMLR
jgi:hypothetical protein